MCVHAVPASVSPSRPAMPRATACAAKAVAAPAPSCHTLSCMRVREHTREGGTLANNTCVSCHCPYQARSASLSPTRHGDWAMEQVCERASVCASECVRASKFVRACAVIRYIRVRPHACVHARMCACEESRMEQASDSERINEHARQRRLQVPPHAWARTHAHMHARTHAITYTCTHARNHIHMHARTQARMQDDGAVMSGNMSDANSVEMDDLPEQITRSSTHARTHACTHARTHALRAPLHGVSIMPHDLPPRPQSSMAMHDVCARSCAFACVACVHAGVRSSVIMWQSPMEMYDDTTAARAGMPHTHAHATPRHAAPRMHEPTACMHGTHAW